MISPPPATDITDINTQRREGGVFKVEVDKSGKRVKGGKEREKWFGKVQVEVFRGKLKQEWKWVFRITVEAAESR